MQSSAVPQTSVFSLDAAKVAAMVLAAVAFVTRWIIGPAVRTYLRDDLRPELKKLEELSTLGARVDRCEQVLEHLADLPADVKAIKAILEERKP